MTKSGNSGFGKRVKETREARSMSAAALARLVNVSSTAVWNWEQNFTTPRSETLGNVASVLGVTRQWLLTGADGAKPSKVPESAAIDLSTFSLEDLMAAIDRKGFEVNVRPKSS